MKDLLEFIQNNKPIYKSILDESSFNLLFYDKQLTSSKLSDLQDCIRYQTLTSTNVDKYSETLCKKLSECISTLINSININDRSYIRITAAGNNIYTKSNTTTELTDNLDISTINDAIIKKAFIPDKTLNADFIVLFNNYIVKHIGILADNKINWNYRVKVTKDVYIRFPIPSDSINKKVLSNLILNNIRR